MGAYLRLAMGVIPLFVSLGVFAASFYFHSRGLAFLALALLIFPLMYWGFLGLIFGAVQ